MVDSEYSPDNYKSSKINNNKIIIIKIIINTEIIKIIKNNKKYRNVKIRS